MPSPDIVAAAERLNRVKNREGAIQVYGSLVNPKDSISSVYYMMSADKEILADYALSILATPPDAERQRLHGWLPIESAPKDGTTILLYDGESRQIGWWMRYIRYPVDSHWRNINAIRVEPTHWQPLPAPPEPARHAAAELVLKGGESDG